METVSPFPGDNMGWQKCSGIKRSYLVHGILACSSLYP